MNETFGSVSGFASRRGPMQKTACAFPLLFIFLFIGAAFPLFAQVVINEIHYHPASELTEDEFIEIYNAGVTEVDLGGWSFNAGVEFTFPADTLLATGGYLVVARDAAHIRAKYHLTDGEVVGNYRGALSNGGEPIEISNGIGHIVDHVKYSDDFPWPADADGKGPSL